MPVRTRALVGAAVALACAAALRAADPKPTPAEAKTFLEKTEAELEKLQINAERANWVKSTYINDDTELLSAQADEQLISASVKAAKQSAKFTGLKLDPVSARKLELLRNSLTLAAPADPAASAEVTRLGAFLEGAYGKGKYCPTGRDRCYDLEELSRILATSRDPEALRDAWVGWHAIGAPLRKPYQRFVELSNQGAKEIGFADTGAMWKSKYDMPPEEFAQELDRLWEQVRPLYVALHTYVRNRLRATYGPDVVPATGPIPAHLLGNMWAQEWGNIYPLVAPRDADPGFDLTAILKQHQTNAKQMVRYGEGFFTSLGFPALPETFFSRSMLTKPRDRDVVCHASAWDIDMKDDVRIKACFEPTAEDFVTVHHELGHNFYQRAYKDQPFLFRDSANDGFHEALGDTIALSITPEYLVKLGFLPSAPDTSKDIGILLSRALDKVAFLPFGLLIDKWRWEVFSGRIPPDKYNQAWWELKQKYQGVAPPAPRTEQDFDPAAKYHVASNTPYSRYFIAAILQFQLHRALAQAAGCKEPLHRCSVYSNAEAGKRLREMLELGRSRRWQEALRKLTGQDKMDASAILDYFAPLKKWLDEQNSGQTGIR